MPELDEVYADAMTALPTSPDYDAAEEAGTPETARRAYAHGSLPLPPPGLMSERIIVHGGTHSYASLSVDFIQVHAQRETYGALGLFIFAGLLAPGPRRFELALTHPESQVRRIILDTSYRQDHWAGLLTEPREIAYLPAARGRHPLGEFQGAPHDLPAVSLTDDEGMADRDWPGDPIRDTLIGFGSDRGTYLIGELLLDISQAWSEAEYTLEGPYGFGGVAPRSAEIRFWLRRRRLGRPVRGITRIDAMTLRGRAGDAGPTDISTTQIYTHVDRSYLHQTHKSFHPRARDVEF